MIASLIFMAIILCYNPQMQSELLIAILAGLGGMFGWGLADFFAKKTIDKIGDTVTLAWGHIFGTLALLIIVLFQYFGTDQSINIPNGINTWLLLILFGALQAVVYLLLYKGFGQGQVGILSPVFASFSGITALLSIVFFGETVTGPLLAGLAILFLGIILVSVDLSALRSRDFSFSHIPGFKVVAISTLLAAFWTLFWDTFLGGGDWLMYTFLMYTFMTVFILIFTRLRRIDLHFSDASVWKFLIFIGLFEVGAYLAISLGYSLTPHTSIIALLSGAFSLPVIILARIFLKEKISRIQTIGSMVIVVGIIFLSLV